MAVGLQVLKNYHPVDGIKIGIAQAGIKYVERDDLVLFELVEGSRVAGVFTTNQFCAAPVRVCQKHLAENSPRYLIVNTGNANAGTGPQGMEDALASCQKVAELTGADANQVLPFSTGVIGEPLPMGKYFDALPKAVTNLSANELQWSKAALGIMTTDTLPKGFSQQVTLSDGTQITISGMSKGAGMIMPNMATMLAYLATDAVIAQPLLEKMIKQLADASFNRVTVDGDTSTNDSCMLVATAKADMSEIESESDARYQEMFNALKDALIYLAQAIVRDGEGATKFVAINVEQAESTEDALKVAYTVAHSPLVKTALFASDANWGRILAAVGRAGVTELNVDKIDIYLGDVCIVKNGGRAPTYTEEAGTAEFSKQDIEIRICLDMGDVSETVWTTDLSHDYVTINAEYRT